LSDDYGADDDDNGNDDDNKVNDDDSGNDSEEEDPGDVQVDGHDAHPNADDDELVNNTNAADGANNDDHGALEALANRNEHIQQLDAKIADLSKKVTTVHHELFDKY
jgi:hypothetical protein